MSDKPESIGMLRLAKYEELSTTRQLIVSRCDMTCRICRKPIGLIYADPCGYKQEFDKFYGREVHQKNGPTITLNYGEEFAHTDCLLNKELEEEVK